MAESILGMNVRDEITGFVGTATGTAEYITGCNQVLVQPKVKDGAYVEGHWFDQQRIKVISDSEIQLDNSRTPGPNREAPRK